MQRLTNHLKVHFIAIGGSIMHQLAIALHRAGYIVSGSDDKIEGTSKQNLSKYDLLPKQEGWDESKITKDLSAIILGMHARKDNPELMRAQQMNLPIYSFPEFIRAQSSNKKRVVIGGSHGKTTITSMLMHALAHNNYDFDYLVGAALEGFDFSVQLSQAPLIILEGDEYLSSPLDKKPKFLHYQPQIALLSGISLDHINVFKTEEDYFLQFQHFIKSLNDDSFLVYYKKDRKLRELVEKFGGHLNQIPYNGLVHTYTSAGIELNFDYQKFFFPFIGEHNVQNLCGAMEVAHLLGLNRGDFLKSMSGFKGAARRLQLLAEKNGVKVWLDFAHSPSKVRASTKAAASAGSANKLVACLELHTFSSLNADFLLRYAKTLSPAQQAIVFYRPQVSRAKQLKELSDPVIIQAFDHPQLSVVRRTEDLEEKLRNIDWPKTDLLLMSSGNFGGLDTSSVANFVVECK